MLIVSSSLSTRCGRSALLVVICNISRTSGKTHHWSFYQDCDGEVAPLVPGLVELRWLLSLGFGPLVEAGGAHGGAVGFFVALPLLSAESAGLG